MHSIGRTRRDPPSSVEVEAALSFLAPPLDELRRRVGHSLARHERLFGPLEAIAERNSPRRRALALHVDLVHAVRATNDIDRALGRTLRAFRAVGGVAGMGYARFGDYVRERLGQGLRWSQERLRLDRLFDASPIAAAAHARGELTTSQVLAIAPMLGSPHDAVWIAYAKTKTVRELTLAIREARAAGRRLPEGCEDDGAETIAGTDISTDITTEDLTPVADESDPGEWISIPAPAALADLFDHTIDVARRVGGSHASVSACVEHILAEYDNTATSPADIDDDVDAPPAVAPSAATLREERLEARHERWSALTVPPAVAAANPKTESPEPLPPTPRALDRELRRLIRDRRQRHDRLARLLAEFCDADGWRCLGFASLHHYCREALGISGRLAQELDRVSTRLRALPAIATAHARGELSWTKLRLVTTVARLDTESAWLARARRCTVRYLEREVRAAHRRRETDPDGWRRDGTPTPITFGAPYGAGSPLRPGAGLWAPAHTSAHGANTAPPRSAVELPCRIRFWLPSPLHESWQRTDRAIGATLDAQHRRPCVPWQRLLVLVRHFLEQWDTAAYERWSEGATVHRRFGWMCAVPGCTARRHLEQHHVVFRSRGGSDDPSNLVTLCATHHRHVLHERGTLEVTGRSDRELVWKMPVATYRGDVRVVGHPPREHHRRATPAAATPRPRTPASPHPSEPSPPAYPPA